MTTRPADPGAGCPPSCSPPLTLDALFPHLPADLRPALLPFAPSRSLPPPTPFPTDLLALPPFDPADLPASPLVAAAVGCPDLFLAAGPPGEERDQFVAGVVEEAVGRGERVLVLTATPSAADRFTDLFPDAVRATGEDNTSRHADRSAHACGAGRAADAIATLTAAIRAADEQLSHWTSIAAVYDRLAKLTPPAEIGADHAALAAIPERVRAEFPEPTPTVDPEIAVLRQQLADVPPAKSGIGKILAGLFGKPNPAAEIERHLAEREQAATARAKSATDEREAAIQAEIVRRQTELGAQVAEFDEFRRGCDALFAAGLTPPASPEDVPACAAAFAVDRAKAEAGAACARRCLSELIADEAAAGRRFLARYRIVVGPVSAVGCPSVTAARFDRILLESADQMTETETGAAATFAGKWVMVGGDRPATTNGKSYRNGTPAGGFHRLWNDLHRPAWRADGDKLVRHLVDCPGGRTCEPLADRPEIELRFGTTAAGEYVLAEVAFPAGEVVAAKQFLASELGDVKLCPVGPVRWRILDDAIIADWPAAGPVGPGATVANGVCESVADGDGVPVTARVTFTGWSREAAEAWVAGHTPPVRAVRLPANVPAEAVLV